jgi:hypothetical protein
MGPRSLRRRLPALALAGGLALFQRACEEERVTAELNPLATLLKRQA